MYKKRQGIGSWIATILLTLYCLIAIVLIGNMVISSFKTSKIYCSILLDFQLRVSFENYRQVLVKDTLYKNFSIVLSLQHSR